MVDKTLLVDADSLVYECACVNEITYTFGANQVVEVDERGAKKGLDLAISKLLDNTHTTKFLIYLTGKHNFRYDILPTYKHNRANVKRPQLLDTLKEYCVNKYNAKITTKIEADDACSIHQSKAPAKTILAHIDKDLNQVEGLHFNWRSNEFYELDYLQGQRFFYEQVLRGDSTDGYTGCPKIGRVKAKQILDTYKGYKLDNLKWVEHEFKDIWDCIKSHYLKALLTADFDKQKVNEYALTQARVARMLRHNEFKKGSVILWQPKKLTKSLKNVVC